MTKKYALKNVIPRLDRGIQVFFNVNTKDTIFLIELRIEYFQEVLDPPVKPEDDKP